MQLAKRKRSEQGLTMMETLVGIMVIGVILFSITPPLLFAFATRLHNYRVQNAMRIAQGEIERVRLVVQRGEYNDTWTQQLPPQLDQTTQSFDLDNVGNPGANNNPQNCPLDAPGGTDVTSWCKNGDFAVQTFRSATPKNAYNDAGNQPIAFVMGVRVYRLDVVKDGQLAGVKAKAPKRDTSIAAPGQSAKLPLVTHYEVIVRSDLDISRATYCELTQSLGGNAPCK